MRNTYIEIGKIGSWAAEKTKGARDTPRTRVQVL